MTRHLLLRSTALCLVASLVVLGGCLGGGSPPSRFYLLSPLPALESAPAASGVAIGVGPVAIPEYLNRGQIVTRTGENQLELAEFDRWAEPLQKNLSRVLVMNLSTLLSTDRVAMHPWNRSTPMDYQVIVDVGHFEAGTDGRASLLARWSIVEGTDRKILRVRKSSFSEPIAPDGYEATVASMSRVVGTLSRQIAEAIREISAGRPRPASEE
jgi:uncharacterized lipoprotein YmbA